MSVEATQLDLFFEGAVELWIEVDGNAVMRANGLHRWCGYRSEDLGDEPKLREIAEEIEHQLKTGEAQ